MTRGEGSSKSIVPAANQRHFLPSLCSAGSPCELRVRREGGLRCRVPHVRALAKRTRAREHVPCSGGGGGGSVVSDPCDPMNCSSPGSSVRGISQALLCWKALPKRGVRHPHLGARN